ncbi:hypothetical protein ACFLTH_11000 [Bacteroidota bacterium]
MGVGGVNLAVKGIVNHLKLYGPSVVQTLLSPIPYLNITLKKAEQVLKRATGLDVSIVISSGSSDIDNDLEYKGVVEKNKQFNLSS